MVINRKQHMIGFFLLILLLCVAPLYSRPNIGGLGLSMPYNIVAWSVSLLFSCLVIYSCMQAKEIVYSNSFKYTLIFPIVIIFAGFGSDIPQNIDWLFRVLYILGGFVFLFSLFQLQLTQKRLEILLYCLVISALMQAFASIVQIHDLYLIENIIPYSKDRIPGGIFQQVNTLNTFLVTGLIIILFLISRPSFITAKLITKSLFVITFTLSFYVIISSGSRVGILSLVISSCLILYSRKNQLKRQKKIIILLAISSLIAAFAGQSGLLRALDKTERMTAGEYSSVRQTMYAIGADLIENKPFWGHGIGSFQRVWTKQVAIFVDGNPEAEVSDHTTSHPHNEILLWMIEGGITAVIALFIILVVVCHSLFMCGMARGGAYLAMLFPITLHTQVELPFYLSSVHWFTWLFLIYIVFRHQLNTVSLTITQWARYSIQFSTIVVGLAGVTMLVHAGMAQKEIVKYKHGKGAKLEVALNDLYFNSFAERLLMQTLLYSSIKQKNKEQIPVFIAWAEEIIQYAPEKPIFIMLSDAYGFIGDNKNQCRVAAKGLGIYKGSNILKKIFENNCAINNIGEKLRL